MDPSLEGHNSTSEIEVIDSSQLQEELELNNVTSSNTTDLDIIEGKIKLIDLCIKIVRYFLVNELVIMSVSVRLLTKIE